jgi:hypothetical protein
MQGIGMSMSLVVPKDLWKFHHKINGMRQPILITVKAGNQMDVINLENETVDAETLN